MMNDSHYGLTAAIYTSSKETAARMAPRSSAPIPFHLFLSLPSLSPLFLSLSSVSFTSFVVCG
jgi:hypothetical protein